MISYETFLENLEKLRSRIAEACNSCGRKTNDIKLLPVTKSKPIDAVSYAQRAGFSSIGENRVQEAIEKKDNTPIQWELIGHLQSNKAKIAVQHFDRIQSVDSQKLLNKLSSHALEINKVIPILLQVNTGEDPAKFGLRINEVPKTVELALSLGGVKLEGFMTVAPLSGDPSIARRAFESLRDLRDNAQDTFETPLPELSMGMSGDLPEAIASGSTILRVGTALFGTRD